MFCPKKILVPTDSFEHSIEALEAAVSMAEKYEAKVHLINVFDSLVQQYPLDCAKPFEAIKEDESVSTDNYMRRLREEAASIAGAKDIEIELEAKQGSLYDVIISEQQEKGFDLIVMRANSKTGFTRYLLGGIVNVPVMII